MGGAVPSAADLLSGFYHHPNEAPVPAMVPEKPLCTVNVGDTTLTREEYNASVSQLMGDNDKLLAHSGSGGNITASSNNTNTLDPSDFLETMSINSWICPPDRLENMDAMSRLSWKKSLRSIYDTDDVSMTSGNPNTTNTHANTYTANGGEQAFHESWTTAQVNNLSSKQESFRSMSTLNTHYLDQMIPTTHSNNNLNNNPNKISWGSESKINAPGNAAYYGGGGNQTQQQQGRASSPPPLLHHSEPGYNGGDTRAHLRPSMFTAGQQPTTGVSQMSMLSDLSDLSFCKKGESMRSLAMKAQMALKSDTTMMSDMSEAMASLKFRGGNI